MKKHNILLPLVGIAATAACMTPMFALTSCHKPQQKSGSSSIPFDTNYFDIDYNKTSKQTYIQKWSAKVIKNPELLKNYDTLNFTNYKDSKRVYLSAHAFTDDITPKYIKKIVFSNDKTCDIQVGDYCFSGISGYQEIDFGENVVWPRACSFALWGQTQRSLIKITLSPKTNLHLTTAAGSSSAFAGQTMLETIDLTRFTTAEQITEVDWGTDSSYNKVWDAGTHAAKGKIIISKKGLQSAWKEKFEEAGWPTADWDNWKFEVAK